MLHPPKHRLDEGSAPTNNVRMPVAQTKGQDLILRLNDVRRAPFNEVVLRAIRRDAEALCATEPVEAYTVLGGVACMRHDVEAMRKAHETALRVAPGDVVANGNYGLSLLYCGLFPDALMQFRKCYALAPHNPDVLNTLIALLKDLGRYQEVAGLLPEWERLSLNVPHADASFIRDTAQFLKAAGISDDDQQLVAQEAASVLAQHGHPVKPGEARLIQNPESDEQWFERLLEVFDASADRIVDLNETIADKIVAMPNSAITDRIVVRYTSASLNGH